MSRKKDGGEIEKENGEVGTEFIFPMEHPKEIALNEGYDKIRQKVSLEVSGGYMERHFRYFKVAVKDFLYPIYKKIFK